MDILFDKELVQVDEIRGHGGFFKAKEVGQRIMAAATNVPISVMETAGEGGAWGIALLASFMVNRSEHESLYDFLNTKIFYCENGISIQPDLADVLGFNKFMLRYNQGLAIESALVENLDAN